MFEDSLFASQGRVTSPHTRWTAAASITVQLAIASLLVALPLLHPEALPVRSDEIKLALPLPKAPSPPPPTVVQRASSAVASLVPVIGRLLVAPRITPGRIDTSPEPVGAGPASFQMGGDALPNALAVGVPSGAPAIRVASAPEMKVGPLHISTGVSAGLLLAPIRPIYPSIAKAAHVEGAVVVEAIISKTGTIESLHVLSGPAMLQTVALDAIRAARYQPFRLNGEPTEVQTTITVNFKMGS